MAGAPDGRAGPGACARTRLDGALRRRPLVSDADRRRGGAPAASPSIDLGPGFLESIDDPQQGLAHSRHGGLFSLRELGSARYRLVRLAPDARTHDVGIARSPCVRPSECIPRGGLEERLSFLVPLAAGGWLAVYVLDLGAQDRRLVVRHASDGEAPPVTLPPDLRELPRRPSEPLLGVSDLERMCARVTLCFAAVSMQRCLQDWLTMSRAERDDLALARFLATPESGGCEAFRDTYGEVAYLDPSDPPGCFGDVAVSRIVTPQRAIDCARLGTACRLTPEGVATCGDPMGARCDACDAAGRAVQCYGREAPVVTDCAALGLDCAEVPQDGAPPYPFCTPGLCAGPLAYECLEDVAQPCLVGVGVVEKRLDCARLELSCAGAQCVQPARSDPTCIDETVSHCDGPYLVYCRGGGHRAVDCRSVGGSTCSTMTALTARCFP